MIKFHNPPSGKALFLLAASLMAPGIAWSAPVSPEKASEEAAIFLCENHAGVRRAANAQSAQASLSLAYTRQGDASPLFYVFNDSEGYVIVSADDKFPAVLGYSNSGRFDENKIPSNMKNWLDGYANQMEHYAPLLPDGFGTSNAPLRAHREPIEPLVTTKWNQDSPYNLLCPQTQYGQAVTGCVATAYAQILNYHKWPDKPVGSNAGVTFDGTTYNWRQMLDVYEKGNYTAAQADAVATLMRQCGAGVNMTYSAWASGAYSFNVQTALTRYFKYDPNVKMLFKDFIPQKEWNEIVYQELAAKRPVYYSGSSPQGGHAFVCDGYDENEYFHFNWGWGGYEDGYFLLTALNPASGGIGSYEEGYTSGQCILVGIKPGTSSSEPTQYGLYCSGGFYYAGGNNFEIRDGEDGDYIYNPYGYTINVQPGIKITPADGNGEPVYKDCGSAVRLESMYGYNGLSCGAITGLEDGVYHITLVCRSADHGNVWEEIPVPLGKQNYVELTVANGKLTYRNLGPSEDYTAHLIFGTPEFTSVVYGNLDKPVRIPVVNVGKGDFNGELSFTLMDTEDEFGGATSVTNKFMVPAGESTNIEITFTEALPDATYNFSIMDVEKIYLDNVKVTTKSVDCAFIIDDVYVDRLTPCFFTEGKASPLNFSIKNIDFTSHKISFHFEILNINNLEIIETLPLSYTVTIPGNYDGRLNIRPSDLGLAPGEYLWRVVGEDGTIYSAPTPMIVNSKIKTSEEGIAYIETSRDNKEAVVVAPEGDPYTGEITVPSDIEGLHVKALRNNAFTFSSATDVTLPETITRLDPGTFYSDNALRNFISESKTIIPFANEIFPGALNNIWLNVDQSLIEDWHAVKGWSGMRTPAWIFKLDEGIGIESGLDIDPSTGQPYSPYRMNFATPLSVKFNAPAGKNIEVIVIVDHNWILHQVIDPATDTLELPAIGLNHYGEIRVVPTSDEVSVDGIEAEDALVDIFTIDGRLVMHGADREAIRTLPAGIYITSERKKILVK